jgi:hypothetical protein
MIGDRRVSVCAERHGMSSEDVSYMELHSGQTGHATIGFCALQVGESVDLEKYVACAEPCGIRRRIYSLC